MAGSGGAAPRGKPGPKTAPKTLDDGRIVGVLERLREGKSLRASCEDMGLDHSTFAWWVVRNEPEGIANQYTQAREVGCEVVADGIDELARTALTEAVASGPKMANAVVQAIRLQVDTLKWTLAKRNPGRYGEKVDMTSGGKPLEVQTIVIGGREVKF